RSSDLRRWLDGLAGVAFRWRGLSFVLRRRLVIFGRWALRVIAILIPKDGLRTVHICRIRSLTLGVNHRIRRQEWIIGVVRCSSLRRGRILLRALILIRVRFFGFRVLSRCRRSGGRTRLRRLRRIGVDRNRGAHSPHAKSHVGRY